MTQPDTMLAGVRVLDLTTFLAGPFSTQILTDMGAEVIKVESREGDHARTIPPHFVRGDSAYFHTVNRTKASAQLDLKHPDGVEVFLAMVRGADVVIENFRPGVMARLGLSAERLLETNPRLVVCSISGFGQDGPRRDAPAYDAMVQALSGSMSLTGHPGSPPTRMGLPIGDLAGGMYGALGILGALIRRDRTGRGERIDVSMFDAQVAMLGYQATYYLHSGEIPGPQGAGHVSIPTYRSFRCRDDRYVMVTANTERMWHGLCTALGIERLLEVPAFRTNADRLRNAEALWRELEPAFADVASIDAVAALEAHGVPVGAVQDVAQALADDQTSARSMVVELPGEGGDSMRVPGNPIKAASMRPESGYRLSPALGADTGRVLRDVAGLDEPAIRALQEAGVAGPFDDPGA